MEKSENEKHLDRIYEEKRRNGLVHASFTANVPVTPDNREDIIEDILAIETAIAEGNFIELDFGDLRWKKSDV